MSRKLASRLIHNVFNKSPPVRSSQVRSSRLHSSSEAMIPATATVLCCVSSELSSAKTLSINCSFQLTKFGREFLEFLTELADKATRRLRGMKKTSLSSFYSVVPAGGIEPTGHVEIT